MSAVLACERAPIEWREVYAIGSYLYLRPGELRALTWGDVDLDAKVVHITKAYDERTGATTPHKTAKGLRDVPIPAALGRRFAAWATARRQVISSRRGGDGFLQHAQPLGTFGRWWMCPNSRGLSGPGLCYLG